METGRLLKAGGGFAGWLQAIERPRFWSKKSEGVVVRTPHWQRIHNRCDLVRSEPKRLRGMANLAGFVYHRPFVEPMAAEERCPVRSARKKVAKPLNEGAAPLRQRLDCYSMPRCYITGNSKIALRLVSQQRRTKARMPSPKK